MFLLIYVANNLGALLLRETFYQIKFANSGSCATTAKILFILNIVNIIHVLLIFVANDLVAFLLRETFYQIRFANSGSCTTTALSTEANRGQFAL